MVPKLFVPSTLSIDLILWHTQLIVVLYMSFDRFLLAVESRDLSQADKSNMYTNFFFPKIE